MTTPDRVQITLAQFKEDNPRIMGYVAEKFDTMIRHLTEKKHLKTLLDEAKAWKDLLSRTDDSFLLEEADDKYRWASFRYDSFSEVPDERYVSLRSRGVKTTIYFAENHNIASVYNEPDPEEEREYRHVLTDTKPARDDFEQANKDLEESTDHSEEVKRRFDEADSKYIDIIMSDEDFWDDARQEEGELDDEAWSLFKNIPRRYREILARYGSYGIGTNPPTPDKWRSRRLLSRLRDLVEARNVGGEQGSSRVNSLKHDLVQLEREFSGRGLLIFTAHGGLRHTNATDDSDFEDEEGEPPRRRSPAIVRPYTGGPTSAPAV